jgi:hypothetical protein
MTPTLNPILRAFLVSATSGQDRRLNGYRADFFPVAVAMDIPGTVHQGLCRYEIGLVDLQKLPP